MIHNRAGWAMAALLLSSAADAASHRSSDVKINRKAEMKTVDGPPENFTGKVTVTGQFEREAPSRITGAIVHFEPGARTAWHKHPLGQTLIVTEGVGWTQVEGGPTHEFHVGDVLLCPSDQRHWHGATPAQGMTHIAIQEKLDGTTVTWMEKVSDADYLAGPPKAD